ncbi:hypothetical protein VP1G_07197 [Cytospora mali]|uniref:Uncharacterized protein n=1 Tax=Cytospora mali TaxID=578113 RepID=A0A194V835_CYTMA|nr:hypothetical protein VP1G_07197 [Valsa mali var. pyri (nom. inval.)]
MPRRRASPGRSLSMELEQHQPPQSQDRRSSNSAFTARFFGEASSMDQTGMAQSGDGDGNFDGNMDGTTDGNVDDKVGNDVVTSGDGPREVDATVSGGQNGTPTAARGHKRKHLDLEVAPVNMTELRLKQLKEDREAYRYDLQWCQDVLDHEEISPAESRAFQMRQLDLGHQLRMTNHRIAELESDMQNLYFFGAPASTSGRPGYTPAFNPRTSSFMNAEPPQERRGPGRPPGSKNRPKDASSTPQAPSSNAQKAAALASAGAKRTLPTEIRVATPNGRAAENPNKRPRVEVGSPIGSTTEDDNDTKETANPATAEVARHSPEGDVETTDDQKTTSSRRNARTRDTTKEDDRVHNGTAFTVVNNNNNNKKKSINASAGAASTPSTPSTPAVALPTRTPTSKNSSSSTGKNASTGNDATEPDATEPDATGPTGPTGSRYQRLGHHMCQLCTSQKYLMQSTPKQPSEPSSWPLRDISKMVTHYTRMHGEHNRLERCMELGRALEDNRGPFRYWLQETKRVKVSLDEVNEAITALHEGHLPDLLRRLSNAARGFPKD